MTPLAATSLAVLLGYAAVASVLRPAFRSWPVDHAVLATSALGTGLVTGLAALLFPRRPELVLTVALLATGLDVATAALLLPDHARPTPGDRRHALSPRRPCRSR